MNTYLILIYISAISFFYYSINSFFSNRLILEFERWGYKKYRNIIAVSQLIASIGLFIGIYYPILTSIMSFLLLVMMVGAIFVRLKIKDKLLEIFPAFFYAILNLSIFIKSIFYEFF